ncbi:MAG: nucleoside deaminase [Defluviitaleaceae bacterium]|nr:nucleoside deaminase [Defluviitaleaceae bacterium]
MKTSFNEIDKHWQSTLELAWESFKNNSLPIAAIIIDTNGNIISTGRNQIHEDTMKNRKMAHAEMIALMNLSYDDHPQIRQYTLYTTMEPCPMCMGSIVMSDIRKVRIAMADPWAGATNMCALPYVASKKIDVSFEGGEVEKWVAVLTIYRELELSSGNSNPIIERLKQHHPHTFSLVEELYAKRVLRECADKDIVFCDMFDIICIS